METAVGSFAIAGATLAQIMHDFGSVEGDCDGLLFGRLQHQTTSSMEDDSAGPAVTHEQITARVTGYYCSGRVQSFYDATGRLNHSRLSNIVKEREGRGEDPPIGWYIGRRNSSLCPSMREAAVTTYLRSGLTTPLLAEMDDVVNLKSSSKSIVGPLGSVPVAEPASVSIIGSRRSIDNSPQTGRAGGSGGGGGGGATAAAAAAGLDSLIFPSVSGSPSRKSSSSASSPRQEKRVAPAVLENIAPLSPCLFVLFTESDSINKTVRTHEYRAFQSLQNPKGFINFEPLPVNIVNAGVVRGFYDSFVPVASIPSWFNSDLESETSAGGSEAQIPNSGKSASLLNNNGQTTSKSAYDDEMASLTVHESVDPKGGSRVTQFESMYQQMLTRLDRLSVEAYESSVALNQSP